MRLIDADALEREGWKLHRNYQRENAMVYETKSMQEITTAQPERKMGKWIEQDDGWDGVYYECSVCKEPFTLIDGTPQDNLYNFCPNCGADMRGEKDETD